MLSLDLILVYTIRLLLKHGYVYVFGHVTRISVYSTHRLLEYSVNLYKSLDSSQYGCVYNNDVSKRFDIYHLTKINTLIASKRK
jgi:hypothetical protein